MKNIDSHSILNELIKDSICMNEFSLKWRFTEKKYNVLPPKDLCKIFPLNDRATDKLERILNELKIRNGYELNENYFTSIIKLDIRNLTESKIETWLSELNIELERRIFLLWDSWGSVITNWRILKEYSDDFFYPGSDDLTIVDENLDWALYFFHEEIIFYGEK